jgi:hypothetical protein
MKLQQTLVTIMVCGKKDLQQISLCAKALGCRNLCHVINNETGNVKHKRNIRARSRNHWCRRGKAVSVTYTEALFVALGNQHAKFRRHITLSSLYYPALQYFSTSPHKRQDYREKVIEHKMCQLCFLMFSTTFSEIVFLLRRFQWGII